MSEQVFSRIGLRAAALQRHQAHLWRWAPLPLALLAGSLAAGIFGSARFDWERLGWAVLVAWPLLGGAAWLVMHAQQHSLHPPTRREGERWWRRVGRGALRFVEGLLLVPVGLGALAVYLADTHLSRPAMYVALAGCGFIVGRVLLGRRSPLVGHLLLGGERLGLPWVLGYLLWRPLGAVAVGLAVAFSVAYTALDLLEFERGLHVWDRPAVWRDVLGAAFATAAGALVVGGAPEWAVALSVLALLCILLATRAGGAWDRRREWFMWRAEILLGTAVAVGALGVLAATGPLR